MVKEMEIMLIAIVGLCMVTFLEAFPQNSSGNKDFNFTSVLKEQEYCGYIISESGEQIWAKKCKNITETDSTGFACQWSDWAKTGTCTKSCGGGVQYFERTMLVKSQDGGPSCIGGPFKRENCNDHDCPAIKDDEFYCQSKEGKYDYACKRCINDEDCDYDYGKLSKFKSCQCSNLELVNKEGEFVGGINIIDHTVQCKTTHPDTGKNFCYVDWEDTTCNDIVGNRSQLGLRQQDNWMFDAYISYEACKQNKSSNIGRELFLPGIKLTSKDLPKGLSGGGFGDITPTHQLCQDECIIRNFTAETKFRKCTFDRKTKFCTPIDLDENRKEGFIPGKLTPEACQNHCALCFGKCGSWSFDHSTNMCYLHDSDGCCNQFNNREKNDNFISGYICSVCWSTKNECPCNKQDRERDSYVGFNFASGSGKLRPIKPPLIQSRRIWTWNGRWVKDKKSALKITSTTMTTTTTVNATSVGDEQVCKTTSGSNEECKFPFTFREKKYDACITGSKRQQPWCPTELDKSGSYIHTYKWGFCDTSKCPLVSSVTSTMMTTTTSTMANTTSNQFQLSNPNIAKTTRSTTTITTTRMTATTTISEGSFGQKQCSTTIGKLKCITTLLSNGNCEVKLVNGPPGDSKGTCSFLDGKCYGIPEPCSTAQCESLYKSSECLTTRNGDRDRVQCATTCQFAGGGCKVKMINGPRGEEEGFCAPKRLGGQCRNIPNECIRGNDITSQCGSGLWWDESDESLCKEGIKNV